MRITASILTYNAMATISDVLAGLEAQSLQPDRVVIVDNASQDGTAEFIRGLPGGIDKLLLDENLGVGAGHNAAWRYIFEQGGCDYIWTLENDSIPPSDCLGLLAATATRLERSGISFGAVTPRQISPGQHPGRGSGGHPALKKTMTFNGALIQREAISAAGFIREDFFLDQEDREYALRLTEAGFPPYRDPEATIVHLGKGSNRPGPPSPMRTYYRIRNETYMSTKMLDRPLASGAALLRALGGISRTLITEDQKARRIRARWRGTLDGLRGELGRKDYRFLS